uniref:Solute carrier family 15 member 2 n=1 Tax=Pygocentrus nattereri TaxID=42514 RepID=A0AAR2IZI2_PYGNA
MDDNVEKYQSDKKRRSPKMCGSNYPLSIAFIVVNEFCERFSYYGMKAVLTLYFIHYLHWNKNLSTAVYHAFSGLCYFTPIIGAIIADSWLGKFKTIIYLSIVYVIGHVIKSVGAIPDVGDSTVHISLSMLGLILIAFGTGGIKPCVAAFGGDQFEEEHTEERRKFFSIFYMSINAGSVLSTIITPILRGDVQCFGGDCYALAFGVPAALMVIATVVFIAGSGLYNKGPPEGNVLLNVCKCIGCAISNRWRRPKNSPKRDHWLDWISATQKYSSNSLKLAAGLHITVHVLIMITFPFVWCQGSRWTLQATRMNMDFMLNALLILVFIPIFDMGVYPLIGLCRIKLTPLRKMAAGMILAALAFCAATVVEVNVIVCKSSFALYYWFTICLFFFSQDPNSLTHNKMVDVQPNNIHIAWQIPQYVLITAGEVMFSITGLEFSYSQAPASMKSVLQAGWLLTVAFGNVIVLIVAEGAGMEQWTEFLLFAALLVAVSIIFSIMSYFYTYADPDQLNKLFNEEANEGNMDDLKKEKDRMHMKDLPKGTKM